MATSDELERLDLERLNQLEYRIRRQRRLSIDHDNRQRNSSTWNAVQRRHSLRVASLASHRRVIQEMIEELRFDVDVLVQDFRRFFAATDKDQQHGWSEKKRPGKPGV